MRYQIVHRGMAPLLRIRFWLSDFIYDRLLSAIVSDEAWQEKLFGSFMADPGQNILIVGQRSSSIALRLARKFPEAKFRALDTNQKALAQSRRQLSHERPSNLDLANLSVSTKLPFESSSFNQIVCFLVLHERTPDEKLALLRDMIRIMRRGGVLHAVELDKPQTDQESKILRVEGRKSKSAVIAHLSGAWLGFIAKAGFSRVKRQSSYSIRAGRLTIINARK